MKKRYRWIAAILVIVMMGIAFYLCFNADKSKIEEIKIVCVGDSITLGLGAGENLEGQSYPEYLQERLDNVGEYKVVNYGVSGATALTPGKVPYTDEEYYQLSLEEKADIYIIMLGTNDAGCLTYNAKEYAEALGKLIESYHRVNRKATIYLLQPPKAFPNEETGDILYSIKDEYIQEICSEISVVGSKYQAKVIDLYHFTEMHENWFVDGIHPNAIGNWNIAEEVYKTIIAD